MQNVCICQKKAVILRKIFENDACYAKNTLPIVPCVFINSLWTGV